MTTGTIFDIKHFAIHDGPGIRTTVFVKGCPLRCLWCHNPESFEAKPQLLYTESKCIGCGSCFETCSEGVHELVNGEHVIHRELCKACGACVEECYAGALELVGRKVTVSDVIEEVLRDKVFYDNSGGGLTVSGGEPLAQPVFTKKLLEQAEKNGVHTALDTSGYAAWSVLEDVSIQAGLILYDLKHMNPETHKTLTGVSNELILGNLVKLDGAGKPIWVRVPLIPGLNDSESHFHRIGEYLSDLKHVERVDILRYHRLAESKYLQAGLEYPLMGLETPSKESAGLRRNILIEHGLDNIHIS